MRKTSQFDNIYRCVSLGIKAGYYFQFSIIESDAICAENVFFQKQS